ncbi:MAG: cobaltochelatase subunit CobN, partial [Chloroflexi bacterium]|nr:cobaltochelatase subunit CobN [Chloroflexota bacterium]
MTERTEKNEDTIANRRFAKGGFLILTHVDTDVLAFHRIADSLDPEFAPVRVYNVSNLRDEDDAITFYDQVVPDAQVVFLKLLGGRASLPGFDYLVKLIERNGQWLIAIPGTEELDPELTAYTNAGVPLAHEAKAYLQLGGLENHRQFLYFLSDHLLATGFGYDAPSEQPRHGIYHRDVPDGSLQSWLKRSDGSKPTIGVLFYRSFLLTGNTSFVDTLVEVGEASGANVLPVYAYSLKDPAEDGDDMPPALRYFVADGRTTVDVIINTMSFAMGGSNPDEANSNEWSVDTMLRLGVPQIQAINAMTDSEQWMDSDNGLTPLDVAMNVAIPELDGRIISVPISFKEPYAASDSANGITGSPVVHNAARLDRVQRVIGLALRFAALRRKNNSEKRIAIALTNHNAKASRIANAVGLDSPASLLHLLHTMRDAGYDIGDLPEDGDELLHQLIERGNYDRDILTDQQLQNALARVPADRYRPGFAAMPESR